jgi:hypothetical protein
VWPNDEPDDWEETWGSVSTSWEPVKGCHVRGLPTESIHRTCVDWNEKRTWRVIQVFPLQGVHRFESSWLSDMSNRLFVAVIK